MPAATAPAGGLAAAAASTRWPLAAHLTCSCLPFLPPSPRRGSPTARSEQLPAWAQEARTLHQGAAEGAREGVRSQQVHHQREAPAHLSHHEPLGAPGHHLVPEPTGEREEGGQQIESASSALHLTVRPPRLFMSPLCTITESTRRTSADHYLILPKEEQRTVLCLTLLPIPPLTLTLQDGTHLASAAVEVSSDGVRLSL